MLSVDLVKQGEAGVLMWGREEHRAQKERSARELGRELRNNNLRSNHLSMPRKTLPLPSAEHRCTSIAGALPQTEVPQTVDRLQII
jgi:hypothetical protein